MKRQLLLLTIIGSLACGRTSSEFEVKGSRRFLSRQDVIEGLLEFGRLKAGLAGSFTVDLRKYDTDIRTQISDNCDPITEAAAMENVIKRRTGLEFELDPRSIMHRRARQSKEELEKNGLGWIPPEGFTNDMGYWVEDIKGRKIARWRESQYGETSDDVETMLREGYPFGMSVITNESWEGNTTGLIDTRAEALEDRAGHKVMVVGATEYYYIFKNSWGEAWGDHGYGYISTAEVSPHPFYNEIELHPNIQARVMKADSKSITAKIPLIDEELRQRFKDRQARARRVLALWRDAKDNTSDFQAIRDYNRYVCGHLTCTKLDYCKGIDRYDKKFRSLLSRWQDMSTAQRKREIARFIDDGDALLADLDKFFENQIN